jgi:Glycosyltransferase family 87
MYFTTSRLRLFLIALLLLQVLTCFSEASLMDGWYIDYRSFYTAGHMVRTGDASLLYDYVTEHRMQNTLVAPDSNAMPFMPPPFAALPFVPLSCVAFRKSYFLFFALNFVFLVCSLALMRPYLGSLSGRWSYAPLVLFLSFLPLGVALMFGQLSLIMLLIACGSLALLQQRRPFLAGLVFSIALVKLQIAIPVALLFAAWRRWRFATGFLLGAVVLASLSLWLVGPRILFAYPHSIESMTASATTRTAQYHFAILPFKMPDLQGLFSTISGGRRWGCVFTLISSIALFGWAVRKKPSLPLALLVGLLVSYHLFIYDLTLSLIPISLFLDRQFAPPLADSPAASQATPGRFAGWRRSVGWVAGGLLLCSPVVRLLIASENIWLLCLPLAFFCLAYPPTEPVATALP